MGVIIGAVLLVGGVVLFVLYPIIQGQWASLHRTSEEGTEADARKRVSLLALRDVEMDFATGKLDEEDYRALQSELSHAALRAIQEVEVQQQVAAAGPGALATGSEPLEAEIAAARVGLTEGHTCSGCGHVNEAGSSFCASCGEPLRR